jgi:Protein of unknown function (DUF3617)
MQAIRGKQMKKINHQEYTMNQFTKLGALCVSLASISGLANAQNFPKMKAGLWEVKTSEVGKQGAAAPVTVMCLDDSVQAEMMKIGQGMMQSLCTKNEFKVSGSQVTGESECKLGATTMRSTSVTTFNGDSSYRTESNATYDPPLFGTKEAKSVSEAKHIGACKPGMKPGDMVVGGQTINIKDTLGGAQKAGKK